MSAVVLRADARALPLPDASVDLIVTSPPYYGLRSYTDGGEHYAGQIGSEATPAEWLQTMLECTREWMRVLKPGGSIFVNLGDKYSAKADGSAGVSGRADRARVLQPARSTTSAAPRKSLLLLPERYRIACVDDLGLTARAVIVWDKPNGLPESVTDRVRRSHEDWVHLTPGPTYYSAIDAIREPHRAGLSDMARGLGYVRSTGGDDAGGDRTNGMRTYARATHAMGRLPGSVWEIPSEPLAVPKELGVDHFAAFPTEWPRRLILGWSPSAICSGCGQGRRPAVATSKVEDRKGRSQRIVDLALDAAHGPDGRGGERWRSSVGIVGDVCACTPFTDHPGAGHRDHTLARRGSGKTGWHADSGRPMPRIRDWREYHLDGWERPGTRPAVVLDPFGGTGTTALVADVLGRTGITVDRSADYCRIARWRTTDPGQRAKAMRVEKPAPQLDGQGDMLSLLPEVPA
jgi:DNA modification methylase